MSSITEIRFQAAKIRRQILELDYRTGGGHIGGALSASDILASLFFGELNTSPERAAAGDQSRDRFVLSKGHISDALYSTLAFAGYFPLSELKTYVARGSRLGGHPTNKTPGIEINTGALGHGLPASVGIAKSQKLNGSAARTFVLTGDGELAEGSNWEAAMSAAHYKLDNLTAVVDRNRLQIGGSTEDVMSLEPLADKWRAFGWEVVEADGHSVEALLAAFEAPRCGRPRCVIAHTVKGKGISFMENNAKWHHGTPSDEEFLKGADELDAELASLAAALGVEVPAFTRALKPAKVSGGKKYMPAREAVTRMFTEAANTDPRIVALTSDARGSASVGCFLEAHPERFIEVGIAEQNEVGMAAGLSLGGKIPFVCAPASFLSARSYEQVKADLAYSHLNVKLLAVSGGASYAELGQTHHSLQDIAVMRSLPGLDVVIPADAASARELARQSIERSSPMYMRVGRAATADVYSDEALAKLTFGKASTLREGADGCIISCGVMTLNSMAAADMLAAEGIELTVIDIHTIAPLDREAIIAAAAKFGRLVTAEEHVLSGGLGSAVCETICENPVPVKRLGVPDCNAICGSAGDIYNEYGLDAEGIAKAVRAWL